jgi:hypothetical protein
MKKRIGTMFLMVVMAIAISGQAFAALPSTKSQEEQAVIKAQLRDVIAGQMSFVNSITGALNESDLVKDLLKDVISGLLSNTDSMLDLTGPVLAGLIEDALREALGDTYPDSVDIGTVINDVLGNDAINNLIVEILENKYFGMFIDKTIDNIFAELDLTPFMGVIVDAIIDNVTEQIWRGGNPTATMIGTTSLGHWNNNTETWNKTTIGAYLTVTTLVNIYNAVSKGDLNAIVGSDGIDLNDLLAAFDINLVLNAAKDALDDVVAEFRADFRAKIRTRIEARVEEFKANAKAKLVDELNALLAKHELDVVLNTDMSLSEIENAIKAAVEEMKTEKREEKKAEIEAKLAKLKTSLFALSKDIRDCIDRIIQCIKDKKGDGNKECLEHSLVWYYLDGDDLENVLYRGEFFDTFEEFSAVAGNLSCIVTIKQKYGCENCDYVERWWHTWWGPDHEWELVETWTKPTYESVGWGLYKCKNCGREEGRAIPKLESGITIVKVEATAFVTKLNGNKNNLTITVTEYYSDDSFYEIVKTFSIDNNAAGTYVVSDKEEDKEETVSYTVYVNTKGNTQIREIYIVE